MSGKSPPTTEEVEKKTDEIFMYADKNKDKRINLEEWTSYVTKNKEILKLLDQYGMMDKDDLRPDFGGSEDPGEYPDCDSDIENEVNIYIYIYIIDMQEGLGKIRQAREDQTRNRIQDKRRRIPLRRRRNGRRRRIHGLQAMDRSSREFSPLRIQALKRRSGPSRRLPGTRVHPRLQMPRHQEQSKIHPNRRHRLPHSSRRNRPRRRPQHSAILPRAHRRHHLHGHPPLREIRGNRRSRKGPTHLCVELRHHAMRGKNLRSSAQGNHTGGLLSRWDPTCSISSRRQSLHSSI